MWFLWFVIYSLWAWRLDDLLFIIDNVSISCFKHAHWIFLKMKILQRCEWRCIDKMNYWLQKKFITKVIALTKMSPPTKVTPNSKLLISPHYRDLWLPPCACLGTFMQTHDPHVTPASTFVDMRWIASFNRSL